MDPWTSLKCTRRHLYPLRLSPQPHFQAMYFAFMNICDSEMCARARLRWRRQVPKFRGASTFRVKVTVKFFAHSCNFMLPTLLPHPYFSTVLHKPRDRSSQNKGSSHPPPCPAATPIEGYAWNRPTVSKWSLERLMSDAIIFMIIQKCCFEIEEHFLTVETHRLARFSCRTRLSFKTLKDKI